MNHEELEEAILHIKRTLILRWWLFGIMAGSLVLGAVGAIANLRSVTRIEAMVIRADDRSLKNEAKIDAAIKQQIIYQQQIAQSIDYLANHNPKIKVPRAIVRPPPAPSVTPENQLLSESELTRPTTPHPTATPRTTTGTRNRSKHRSSPTPGPFQRFFNPRSTR